MLVFLDSHLDFYTCRIMVRVETALLTSLYKRILNANAVDPSVVSIRKTGPLATASSPSYRGQEAPAACRCTATEGKRTGAKAVAEKKGAIFNIIFVDVPSIAEMVLTGLDLMILPVRMALAVTLLVLQVGAVRNVLLWLIVPVTAPARFPIQKWM